MRFLDCVDRRDGAAAALLFHPEGVWSTAFELGDVSGAENIAALVNAKLPPRRYDAKYARHEMEPASDMDDLTVLAPDGSRCRFEVGLDGGAQSRTVIGTLRRKVLQSPET